jgi:hypothetical protein
MEPYASIKSACLHPFLESRAFHIRLAHRVKRMDAVLLLNDEVQQRLMSLAKLYMPRDLCYVSSCQQEVIFLHATMDRR